MAQIFEARQDIKIDPEAKGLCIGLPVRKTSPVEFWIHFYQALHPLNVKTHYIIQKAREPNVEDGSLPAEARNKIMTQALESGATHIIFLDDDILFPDITFYRLWVLAQQYPQAACITGIYGTKLTPSEPLMYKDGGSGAYWDWPLGVLLPIESAGAGCMIVNLDYVRKLSPPWFNDVIKDSKEDGLVKRNHVGHDRFFHIRLKEEAGGQVYADTGLLLGHWDSDLQKVYILPPNSPCFQRKPLGESFVPYINDKKILMWRRYVFSNEPDPSFLGYLDWVKQFNPDQGNTMELLKNENPDSKISSRPHDEQSPLGSWLRRTKGLEPGSGDQPDPGGSESRSETKPRHTDYVQRDGYSVADSRRVLRQDSLLPHDRTHTSETRSPIVQGNESSLGDGGSGHIGDS